MAIPSPDTVYDSVKVTPIEPDAFISDLSAAMSDQETVQNGLRPNGQLAFYIPGYLGVGASEQIRGQLLEAGWAILSINQQQGYMPTNVMTDFRNADSTTPGVQGYPSFPWVYIVLARGPKKVTPT